MTEKEIRNKTVDECLKILDEVMKNDSITYKVLRKEFRDLKEKEIDG